ncbi:MAG TPA: hypothetical protein EYP19_14480, partial [Desulfobacterales bacterium]|nr:hypothetical protein [Desulfobacterales bacterium]
MQPIFVLLILLILMAATAAAIAGVVIYKRKGRQGVKSMLAGEDRPIKQEKVPVEEEPQPNSDDAQLQTAQRTDLMALPEPPATVLSEAQVWKAQTPEPTGTEEAKHPLAKEAQECTRPSRHVATAGEETKQTVIDVIQPPTREETESPAKEPLQPPETEESRETKLPQTSEKPRKRRRVPPRDRGGRPRSYTQNREEVPAPTTVSYRPRPEIVCWKRERQWFIGVEAPDDLLENSDDLEIHQNGQSLSPDDYEETCWPLCSVGGQVTVKWKEKDASQSFTLTVDQEGYLLFKLSGQDLNKGRLVKSVSSGSYLVITPDTWERDETIAGPPPVAPEPVALDGYLAHFFELEKSTDTEIAFCTPEAVPISISSRAARFELIGEKVEDASEKMGPLFIKPPRIRAVVPNPQGWKGIKTIVVGEEGSGRGRWRTQFSPDPKHTDQDLPSEVLARKGGWYFLRFYNRNDDLVESLDFRFLSGLNRIEMPESSPLPSNDG